MINAIVSILIPGLCFKDYDEEFDEKNFFEEGRFLVKSLMMNYAIFISSIGFIVFVFYENKPNIPVSYSSTIKRENFSSAFKKLIRHKNYLFCLIGASLAFGS